MHNNPTLRSYNTCPYCKEDLTHLLRPGQTEVNVTEALEHTIFCVQDDEDPLRPKEGVDALEELNKKECSSPETPLNDAKNGNISEVVLDKPKKTKRKSKR